MARSKPNSATVGHLLAALDDIAPLRHAAEWDNVGLLAGRADWPASRVLLALDLTDAVADEALRKRADAILLYHPPIFKGIHAVTPDADSPTSRLPDLLAARCALLAIHTAYDVARAGINDILLDVFQPRDRQPLQPELVREAEYKLVVFVPPTEVAALRKALSAHGAGVIGHYSECSYELTGRGTFLGDETTNPTVGQKLNLETADETRLEMVVPQARLGEIVRAIYAHHSYEEPAFDLYPLHTVRARGATGMGRIATLAKPQRGDTLVRRLAARVDLSTAQVVGRLTRSFRRVITAAGAFGVNAFRDPDALVFTGEFKHHDALALLKRGVTAVTLGHYASERPALDALKRDLAARVAGARFELARSDRSPFTPLRR